MKHAVALLLVLGLAGCAPSFEKSASVAGHPGAKPAEPAAGPSGASAVAPLPQPAPGAPAVAAPWPDESRKPVTKFAASPGGPAGDGFRRIAITGSGPANEIEVTDAQLKAEIRTLDRMLEGKGQAGRAR